ncbi:MAG: tannase/feruloyl esterase family alpha/beta hydrolase [Rhodospirillaceae bacterium]|nr:tannase/feruloyl esterase family alpha/beta hydrolase [Rhodospirillaceae bacterium]
MAPTTLALIATLMAASPAGAVDPTGSPWLAIDDAACVGLKLKDFAVDVGAPVTVTTASVIAAGADGRAPDLPAHCRLTATIAPQNQVEIRLPVGGWSGRVLTVGCGGLCGSIQMERTDDALIRGYAVAHTDMGHSAADMSFADDPALLDDFVHRATHLATVLLKSAAGSYYGRAPTHSYFRGCSTGGRQGLTAMLMHPDDYDGIIAGAPAAGPGAVPNIAWTLKSNMRADGSPILDAGALDVLHAGVMAACDGDDGAQDGLLANPDDCTFDPRAIVCGPGGPENECLTPAQANAAAAIYDGVAAQGRRAVSRGFARGGEMGWKAGLLGVNGGPPGYAGVARNYLRRFPGAAADLAAFDFTAHPIALAAVDTLPSAGDGGERLRTFRDAGGKLLFMHAWSDNSLTPATAIDVYNDHAKTMGGHAALDGFYRLFVVPGVWHCGGGEGPDAVDTLAAIEAWVEKGQAPERLMAFKTKQRLPYPREYRFPIPDDQVVLSRPVFPWPVSARYTGRGDVARAESWEKSSP